MKNNRNKSPNLEIKKDKKIQDKATIGKIIARKF